MQRVNLQTIWQEDFKTFQQSSTDQTKRILYNICVVVPFFLLLFLFIRVAGRNEITSSYIAQRSILQDAFAHLAI